MCECSTMHQDIYKYHCISNTHILGYNWDAVKACGILSVEHTDIIFPLYKEWIMDWPITQE